MIKSIFLQIELILAILHYLGIRQQIVVLSILLNHFILLYLSLLWLVVHFAFIAIHRLVLNVQLH